MIDKKMPLAIICLSPNKGGMEINALKLSKNISEYISDVTLIVKSDSFLESLCHQENIKPHLKTIDFKYSLSFQIISKVRNIIIQNNIKNIIFFGASELKSLYFAFLGLDINLIVRHGTTKSSPKKDFFHRLIYSKVNYHIAVSKHILNNVKTIVPYNHKTQFKVIYNSVKIPNQYIKEDKKNFLSILHLGRITKGKGQIDAIKACKVLYENNIEFEFNIIGSINDDYEKEFMRFYNSVEYKNKINLIGHTNNVGDYLKKSDIFLFPSYGEGLSNAYLEALAYKLICISYNNTSFGEFFDLGFDVHLCVDKDLESLSNTLLKVVKKFSIEKEKVQHNFEMVSNMFSIENEMKQYLMLLR